MVIAGVAPVVARRTRPRAATRVAIKVAVRIEVGKRLELEAIGDRIAMTSASTAIVPATGHAIAPNLVAIVVVRRTWRRLMKTTRCS